MMTLLAIQEYFKQLHGYDSSRDNEHTYRTQLENLLKKVCEENSPGIQPRHEISGGEGKLGIPDFSFLNKENFGVVGLLETKKIGGDIQREVKSPQIKKYRKYSENIILTNYHQWLLLEDGEVAQTATLGTVEDIKNKRPSSEQGCTDLKNLLQAFLSVEPCGISRTKELAEQLALRCLDIREFLTTELKRQLKDKESTRLVGVYRAFQESIDSQLSEEIFADAFSQTLGYSLFIAKLNLSDTGKPTILNLDNLQSNIPMNFALIRSLADFLKELNKDNYQRIYYRVEEILGMMNHLDMSSITKELSGDRQLRIQGMDPLIEKDPFMYFYEHFLQEYDSDTRRSRGVYYTPPSVVRFIIRSVNEILQKQFGIADGLADPQQIQLLDFATGTGTFLLEAMREMFEQPGIISNKTLQQSLVNDHICQNFYGFEYLIAPYTVAHLKLSHFLKHQGLKVKKPLNIYLTNTLEVRPGAEEIPFLPELAEENRNAYKVKRKRPIRVIVGNPPYSVGSQNKAYIKELRRDYKPHGEQKLNWDDYVKFIHFAHKKMEKVDRGVIGIISNNSFLSAITLRRMRNSLMGSFNAIYILNLHGNSLINELAPDGKPDKNVFDIKVGVAISLMVKTEEKPQSCQIYYADIQSSNKQDKWKQVLESSMDSFQALDVAGFNHNFAKSRWSKRFYEGARKEEIEENKHLSLFVPMQSETAKLVSRYGDFWGMGEIFEHINSGVKTERDSFTIHYTKKNLETVLQDCRQLPTEEVRQKYKLKPDKKGWNLESATKSVKDQDSQIVRLGYRPFDERYTLLNPTSSGLLGRPGYQTMRYMVAPYNNTALIVRRMDEDSESWQEAFVADKPVDIHCFGGQTYVIPLRYPRSDQEAGESLPENFHEEFRQHLNDKYHKVYSPEEVLGYIYAVLHSPTFCKRYRELLKLDFPRIPFVDSAKQFEALSALGGELVQVHLLKQQLGGSLVSLQGEGGDNLVDKVYHQESQQRLFINSKQYFDQVPLKAWEFKIGGYQVLDKYLGYRERASRRLDAGEQLHIRKVVGILTWTQQQMQKIDKIFPCP